MQLLRSPAADAVEFLRLVEELATHHRRVRAAAARLCDLLGVPYTRDLDVAAGLHDLGKLPLLHVVSSPRSLLPSEWDLLRLHPLASAILLQAAGLEGAARIAAAHHEHWDGAGYPNGLAREEIPLPARVLAGADTLAALMEPRPYRRAHQNPTEELRRAAGRQLDPEVARAALYIVRQAERP